MDGWVNDELGGFQIWKSKCVSLNKNMAWGKGHLSLSSQSEVTHLPLINEKQPNLWQGVKVEDPTQRPD